MILQKWLMDDAQAEDFEFARTTKLCFTEHLPFQIGSVFQSYVLLSTLTEEHECCILLRVGARVSML
jgi:hypothetical protein